MIKEEVAVVPGIDGQKMSKSYKNVIPLFGSEEEIKSCYGYYEVTQKIQKTRKIQRRSCDISDL
ncbi:MAG: hypothetical protein R3B39_00945 [Candidatus Paceibacterota bacterium]